MQQGALEQYRREMTTADASLSYLDVGQGPVTLFVHGFGTNAYLWRHAIVRLSTDRRCIAIDLPLHGSSPLASDQDIGLRAFAGLLNSFTAELDLTQIDLVANDTGGAIAQIAVATSPRRWATMTLTNCEAHDNVPPKALRTTMLLAKTGLLARVAPRLLNDLDRARRVVYGDGYENVETLPLDIVRSFLTPIIGDRRRARLFQKLLRSLRASDLLAVEDQLRNLVVPTLVVWGTNDRFFDPTWATWLCDTIPESTGPRLIDQGRLFFPDERAAELTEHLVRFWDGVRASH